MNNKKYTRLLNRQIRKFLPPSLKSEDLSEFLDKVNDSYVFYENDRDLLSHAMEINSKELTDKNEQLLASNKKLINSEANYKNLIEHNHVSIISLDSGFNIVSSNSIFSKFLKVEADDYMHQLVCSYVSEESKAALRLNLMALAQENLSSFTIESRYLRGDNTVAYGYAKYFGEYDADGKFLGATATILDITDNKKQEQLLFENVAAIENLDRERLAYLLHEGVGQNIASVQFMLQDISKSVMGNPDLEEKMMAIKALLNDTLQEVRTVSYKMIPEHIAKFGFIESIESMVDDLNRKFNPPEFTFYTNMDNDIHSPNTKLTIYRIIQEGVNNIIKHAKAYRASIQLIQSGRTVSLVIEDDGVGFDTNKVIGSETAMGLKSIINRGKSINGDVMIESNLFSGTTITVQIFLD